MDIWCEKYPDCAEGVVREWQVLGLVTGYFSLCTLCPLFPLPCLLQMNDVSSWDLPPALINSLLTSSLGFCLAVEGSLAGMLDV